ncbi:assimilatory sulfite reductase (NADPH) flavoprotein subunit [Pseudoxanthomonas broegbernensis]|uniref:Sulfite reductase [NADPH] flavoprotein alpha-component n=1 Tax=Pseudoxanthomonas broegbernensis TaxID=83619 RepID=A0A7V8GNU2_9GAMM|nr:assimilatory sulfite reductase (NADPH) flavoprotein subunit [Pseudoxanthomonas broegbernensis]KAF1687333.1 assimilatory sulfite reductase (NADPH) flavoprotein subunit [Pseudoxanthomonas broegbernensis]MBB6065667.1 sulfite reductase (NADPH) flavoprotein alpha-component [Pseudoxanthomonas broegbernensis]
MTAASPALPPSPLNEDRKVLLARLVEGLDGPSLWWLSGYTAGLAQGHAAPHLAVLPGGAPAAAAAPQASQRLTVLYGSQTGNARREAEKIVQAAEAAGLAVRLARTDTYPTRELAGERLLYVVISTQGEGDPPDDAIGFTEFLLGRRAPKLPELKFAVLGLGDSSYVDFCGIARKLDARLAELGAQRLADLGQADVDIDTVAAPWRDNALAKAGELLKAAAPAAAHVATVTPLRPAAAWTHERPFQAELLASQRITGREFRGTGFQTYATLDKDVRHIELSLEGSGLAYEPGDALGIHHRNPPALVEAVLQATGLDGDAAAALDGQSLPLAEALAARRELTRLSRPFLAAHAERSGAAELQQLLEPGNAGLAALLGDHQLVDVLRRWPASWAPDALLAALRPQTHRLYSIASSRKRVGEEVHLTVDVLGYQAHGHDHLGAASGFLAALEEGAQVPVYIEPNERFRVPADASRDIIMIGPGTGVAPFRAFVQERAETGAGGRNWLFFGAQHFNTGFLYQTEWQEALERGELHRIDLAFSRDQAQRVYVQQRLRERGRDVYDWLQNGAHLYVCGAIAMGKDVHAALLDIVAANNGGDAEAAAEYLTRLQTEGRYGRDVY